MEIQLQIGCDAAVVIISSHFQAGFNMSQLRYMYFYSLGTRNFNSNSHEKIPPNNFTFLPAEKRAENRNLLTIVEYFHL